jgi:uncharacterized membrane protein
MVIIPVRNILSPIRVMVTKTACPAMKLAGLWEHGFRDVLTTNCGGKLHAFVAKIRSGIFKVKVYSGNGRIHSIRSI